MKRALSLGIALILLAISVLAVIPTSAVSAGPYNYEEGCIKSISVDTTTSLNGATYYKATVNSSLHGLNTTYHNLTTHLAIGGENAKFFVYSGESADRMAYERKTVAQLIADFEKENPAYQVLAALNGDFFNTTSGEPEDPMIQNGQMLKAYMLPDDEARGRGLVGIDDTTGELVYHTVGEAYKTAGYGTTYKFDSIYQIQVLGPSKTNAVASYDAALSKAPTINQLSFTTSDYGRGDYSGKTVYVVELDRYRKDTGSKNNINRTDTYYFAEGEIVDIIDGTNDMKPAKGQAYIAVISTNQAPLLRVGETVRCQKVLSGDWKNVSNAIGFKQQILAEGNLMFYNAYSRYHTGDGASQSETAKWTEDIYDYPHCWKARTAIGFKADGTPVLMVIPYDGTSVGATYYEMSCQFKALGCTNAFLLDGGGSSTMVIRDENGLNTVHIAENTNDGQGRAVGNIAIIAVLKEGATPPAKDEGTPANKQALDNAIATASELRQDHYGTSDEIWNEFSAALENAKAISKDFYSTQKAVDSSVAELTSLMNVIKGIPEPEPTPEPEAPGTESGFETDETTESETSTTNKNPSETKVPQPPEIALKPTDEDGKKEEHKIDAEVGCSSSIALSALVAVGVIGTAIALKKKED